MMRILEAAASAGDNVTRSDNRMSLHARFAAAGSGVMLIGMLVLGWWTGHEIADSVTRNSAISTALYMESFIAPLSQEFVRGEPLSPETADTLEEMFSTQPLSDRILSVKIWHDGGLIAYATDPTIIGQRFEPSEPLAAAWRGELSAAFDDLNDDEDAAERSFDLPLLEVYNPIHSIYTGDIIAVAEFYQIATELEQDLFLARLKSWLVVACVFAATFALLFGIVRKGSHLIESQKDALEQRLIQITRVSRQNEALRRRVQAASAGVSELNEQFLKRLSADLHDGPAQSVAFASLRLDRLKTVDGNQGDAMRIKTALDDTLSEIRHICHGLSLPEIEGKSLDEVLKTAVRAHEKRTHSTVELTIDGTPGQGFDHAARICVFRFVQEALNNAFRHAAGSKQTVKCHFDTGRVTIKVSDNGSGFDQTTLDGRLGLGLRGLRERIESQGGTFEIHSARETGTLLKMTLTEIEESSDE